MKRSNWLMLTLLFLAACRDAPAHEVLGDEAAPSEGEVSATTVAQEEPTSMPTAPATTDGTEHFGAPFALAGPPIGLNEALQTCAGTGTACQIEGTIEAVCQRRGCWFTLAAPDVPVPVRVHMLDYGFFLPTDSAGARVVVEGTLASETVPQDLAQHYADEAVGPGETPRQVTGPETIYEIEISGAAIYR